jgi:hypothetical protein
VDDIDASLGHQSGQPGGDVPDDIFLPLDQGSPIEPRRFDFDCVIAGSCDLGERVGSGDQDLFRRAAAIGACAAEVASLYHCDGESGGARRYRDAHAGIAAAQDHDIILFHRTASAGLSEA